MSRNRDATDGLPVLTLGPVSLRFTNFPIPAVVSYFDVDAIVSSDDSELSMWGGVSKAIATAAGPAMVAEARRQIPLPIGSIAVTSAGDIDCAYVLHAVTLDLQTGFRPTERTIRHLMRRLLQRCESLKIRRVAIPAIGTGAAGFAANECAQYLLEELDAHVANPTVLAGVILSLPGGHARDAFNSVAKRYLPQGMTRAPLARDMRPARVLRWLGWGKKDEEQQDGPEVESTGRGDAAGRPVLSGATTIPPATVSSLETGERIGLVVDDRYVLLEELGRGGMGVVYLAWDRVLSLQVAVKIIRPDLRSRPAVMESLRREAALSLELTHQGIVRVFHYQPSTERSSPYLVMEYLKWLVGDRWIADAGSRHLPVGTVVKIGVAITEALSYAHDKNVMHGDIKPSNVFIDPAGEKAKIADFGLARVVAGDSKQALLIGHQGTPAYMAPEQRAGTGTISPRTDIFCLAATLWDMATGRPPTPHTEVESVSSTQQRLLSALAHGLQPDPTERPSTAEAFGRLLENSLHAA